MDLLFLFDKCLAAKYNRTPESGDFAIQLDGKTVYLLFQKSSGCTDWRNNLDFPAKPYRKMDETWNCHRGFLRVWLAMQSPIELRVADLIRRKSYITDIVCVGYSHGAALALFATEDMVFRYGDRFRVSGYGFGCPRVVWGHLPKTVRKRFSVFTVIRNIPDIVTHLPPAVLMYHHVGNMLEIGESGKYTKTEAHTAAAYRESLIACGALCLSDENNHKTDRNADKRRESRQL